MPEAAAPGQASSYSAHARRPTSQKPWVQNKEVHSRNARCQSYPGRLRARTRPAGGEKLRGVPDARAGVGGMGMRGPACSGALPAAGHGTPQATSSPACSTVWLMCGWPLARAEGDMVYGTARHGTPRELACRNSVAGSARASLSMPSAGKQAHLNQAMSGKAWPGKAGRQASGRGAHGWGTHGVLHLRMQQQSEGCVPVHIL